MQLYIRINRNESQPGLQLVKKPRYTAETFITAKTTSRNDHRLEKNVPFWLYTLSFHIRMLFFRARLNIRVFLPILAWKYSCIILELYLKKKEFIIFFFAVCSFILLLLFFGGILLICISRTLHRTVINTEHLAI